MIRHWRNGDGSHESALVAALNSGTDAVELDAGSASATPPAVLLTVGGEGQAAAAVTVADGRVRVALPARSGVVARTG